MYEKVIKTLNVMFCLALHSNKTLIISAKNLHKTNITPTKIVCFHISQWNYVRYENIKIFTFVIVLIWDRVGKCSSHFTSKLKNFSNLFPISLIYNRVVVVVVYLIHIYRYIELPVTSSRVDNLR